MLELELPALRQLLRSAAGEFSFTLSTGGFTFSSLPSGLNEIDSLEPAGGRRWRRPLRCIPIRSSGSPGLPTFDVSYLNPLLFDFSGAALSSVALTGIPWTIPSWPSSRSMVLFAGVFDGPVHRSRRHHR